MPCATPAQPLHTSTLTRTLARVPGARIWSSEQVHKARARHEQRADALTSAHRQRKALCLPHPVEDFLFAYYPFSPAQLRRWHPGMRDGYDSGADAALAGHQDVRPDGSRRWYVDDADGIRRADVAAFLTERGEAVAWIDRLLRASSTHARGLNLSCFGLHEWAMVYRLNKNQRRHSDLPLRLSEDATNEVIESSRLVCSHVDAFRFFTPDAAVRNASTPTRSTQIQRDNPACLHVGMDLYKWVMKLVPLVDSSLVLDTFEHARQIRVLDMEASPYDCRGLGYSVVAIETPEGREEYVRRQRELADRSQELRARILAQIEPVREYLPDVAL